MTFYKELGKKLRDHHEHIDSKVEKIDKHVRYVNTDLDYCYLSMSFSSQINVKPNTVLPFNVFKAGNIEYDAEKNYSIKLKAGKTYKISVDYVIAQGFCTAHIYNIITKERIASFVKIGTNHTTAVSSSSCATIYTPAQDCEIQILVTWTSNNPYLDPNNPFSHFIVEEINRQIVIDPLEHVNDSQGIEDTPVGHIISHMGTVAPKHYLICDGAEYNIEDYPYLAQHIEDNFGSINFFGGDGVNTFAVPDLRGEFLRGSGNNGANVGIHQDATEHVNVMNYADSEVIQVRSQSNGQANAGPVNMDTSKAADLFNNIKIDQIKQKDIVNPDTPITYTSRPTNTSVLYCIKYEPTYFMNTYNTNYMQPSMYSLEEKVVGCWINGKPLYEKVVNITLPNGTTPAINPHNIENFESLVDFSLMWYDTSDNAWYDRFRSWSTYGTSDELNVNVSSINITAAPGNTIDWSSRTNAFCVLQYTKTSDAENSFTNDMLKDSYVELTYSDEEISTMVSDILGGEE